MADNTIDTLELEIKSSSTSAVHALEKLAATLEKLNTSFRKTNKGGMRNYAREIGRVSASIKALSGIKVNVTNLSGVGKKFEELSEKLSGIDTTKIQATSDGIAKISHSMSLLNNVDFKDSKITNVLGALKRLAGVDMGKFDSNGIASIVSSISNLSDIPDVSSGLNRFMSSLQKLVNAGDKTKQVANQLPTLGKVLKNVVNNMAGAKKVSESVNLFVQSIGRLASAGNKTGQTAGQLKKLADETLKFFGAMQNAPKISENTIRMTQALAQLASAGGKVGTATSTITKSFNKISNIGSKTLSAIKKVSSGIISSFQKIGSSSHHLKTASFNLGNLLKTAVGFGAIHGLWNFGKQSVKLGSDITEVQNVVDVAFGSMAGMVDEFAATSAEKFGLSELAAKQYSGTMMAMLKSSGVAKDAAAEMSTTLAGLAGDIASFYNIDTDLAFQKIRSGIAGEIEPLRQLGISMTVANLEAFALSQGITKSYQAMTQAEQAVLRYNYLMYASADAQGDFARTSMSWANQVRILKLNFQQLSATIGQGLIAAILPVVQVLNALLAKLMQVANAFKNFVYTLMGKKVESSTGGIVQDISGIGDAGNSAAGGLGNAADAAGELKKKLSVLPFDQLNQLTDNANNVGGGGAGGGGGGDYGFGDLSDALDELGKHDVEGPINEWAKRIREAFLAHDWDKLGFEIADGLNRGLQEVYDVISWQNVGPKITAFTTAFTMTFNSLVDNFDWDLLGRTIGNGINTIVNTLNQLITGIDWINLGKSFADGIMGIFRQVNWINLGNLLGNGFMISWNILYGLVTNLEPVEIGMALANAVNGIFQSVDFETIGLTFAKGFNSIFSILKNFTSTVNWSAIATNIYTGLNSMIQNIDWAAAGESLSLFVTDLLGTFVKVAQETDWEGIGRGIGQFLSNIDWFTIIGQVGTIIWEAFSGMLSGLFDTGAGKVILGFAAGLMAVKGVFKLVDLKTTVQEWVNGTHDDFLGIGTFLKDKVAPSVSEGIGIIAGEGGLFSKLFTGASSVVSKITPVLGSIGSVLFSPKGLLIAGIVAGVAAIILNWDKIKEAAGKVKDWVSEKWTEVKEATTKLWGNISDFMSKTWDNLKSWASDKFNNIKDSVSNTWSKIKEKTSDVWSNVKSTAGEAWDKMKTWASDKFGDIKNTVSKAWDGAKNLTSTVWSGIKSNVSSIWSGLDRDASGSFGKIDKTISSSSKVSSDTVSKEWGNISKNLKRIFNDMSEDVAKSAVSIEKEFSSMSSRIDKSIGNLYNSGKRAAQSFANGFRSVHIPTPHIYTRSYTRHRVGDTSFSTPNFGVDWYKMGGLFDKASIIGVGEAGKEAVLPLENRRTMSMIADSILSNSSGIGMDESTLTNAVARGVAMAMMNQQNPINVTCYAELKTEDNEVLARAVTKGQRSIDSRMNPTVRFGY